MSATLVARRRNADAQPHPPTIRVGPVPRLEPPTDDQLEAAGWDPPSMSAPALPLELAAAAPPPAPRGAPSLPTGPTASGHGDGDAPASSAGPALRGGQAGRVGSSRSAKPAAPARSARIPSTIGHGPATPSAACHAARRFLATCLEVVGGFRPVTHLRSLCDASSFAHIAEQLTGRTAITPAARSLGAAHFSARTPVTGRTVTGGPPRAARTNQTSPDGRVMIRRVQVCEPLDGIAEVAVVLSRHERVWAMALRLERRHGGWQCSHLEVL